MAINQYVNKVVKGDGTVVMDISNDTVTADKVLTGYSFHAANGEPLTGNCTFDADTSDATVTVAEILNNKTAYKNGEKITGTMPNRGGASGNIATKAGEYVIQNGYHDGSGKVTINSVEQAKIIPGNIKSGVTLLGVEGTYTGEAITAQSKSVTPSFSSQTILPDVGYDYLSQVTVAAIPYTETDNPAGGKTVTIG